MLYNSPIYRKMENEYQAKLDAGDYKECFEEDEEEWDEEESKHLHRVMLRARGYDV